MAGGGGLLLLGAGVCLLAGTVLAAPSASPAPSEREFHFVPPDTERLQLAHGHVDRASVRVYVDGRLWIPDRDYRLRTRSGVLVRLRPWRDSSATGGDERALVIVIYEFMGIPATARSDLRPVVNQPQSLDGGELEPLFTAPTVDGGLGADNLQVSGSKTVQVSSGTRRELTVDQNLRLNIVGQLTQDISVRAFLSDDNLPVVPEGNTEELRDIDKVLVELRGNRWAATLGDFVAERHGTVFGRYRRKLQGISAEGSPGQGRFEVLAGSPRGRYRTLQIRGEESNQGPYQLGGSPGTNLFVVAGSERVNLDGEVLVRGADRDYVIDYVKGTVTFTYQRMITAESTIVVEYEEGEGPYGRTVVGGGGGAGFTLPGTAVPADLGVRVIRERDDPRRLRTGTLGEDDEAILAAAGDDPDLAVAPGATAALPGEGLYDQQLVAGKIIYVHNPAGGDWNLQVYYVGPGAGDYEIQQITAAGDRIYEHRGDGLGSYRIGRPLPLPESRSVMTMTGSLGDTNGAHVNAEWDVSDHDRNLLSSLDDEDNRGQAANVRGQMPAWDIGVGRLGMEAFYTARQASFRGFELHKNVFDYDNWGLADRARREGFLAAGEREAGARLDWEAGQEKRRLALGGSVGTLIHGVGTDARRWNSEAKWRLAGGSGEHEILQATARDDQDPLDVKRLSTRHRVAWVLGPLVPTGQWHRRSWDDARISGDRAAGFRYEEWTAGLGGRSGGLFDWGAAFTRGLADSLRTGDWGLERDSRTSTATVTTGNFAGLRLSGEATVRSILRPDQGEEKTQLARVDLSGRWDRSASDWSLGYRVDTSRKEIQDRQIVFVGPGQGDYNQNGEYLGPDQGDYDVILAGSGVMIPTTAVQADVQWRQGFRFLGADRWYGAWTVHTSGTVASRSTTDDVAGLLTLDPDILFDPEHTVVTDIVFGPEITLLQHLRTVDLRGKHDFRRIMDRRFVTDPEDRITRNWQFTGNVNVSQRSSVRLRWAREDERRETAADGTLSRRGYKSLVRRWEAAWNWRPLGDLRLGLQGEYIDREDEDSGVQQTETAVRPTVRHRFRRDWTLQGELRWAVVASDEPAGALRPWFYPLPGRNAESTVRLAWDPNRFLGFSVSWFTRKQGDRRWQHDLRLESTARF